MRSLALKRAGARGSALFLLA